tara:strand:- start:88 stop:360 length:273 start_codon:yes stop_codon:yes gene_type:complete
MYIEDKETPDLNSLLKEQAKKEKEPKKNQIKVYRFWQKFCFVFFGGGIIFELIVGTYFSSPYMLVERRSGPLLLWSLILIIALMFGKKTK